MNVMRTASRVGRRLLAFALALAATGPVAGADGELDPVFGARALPVGVASPQFSAGMVQADGRIVLAAWGSTADAGCASRISTALVRLLPDGQFDGSFGDTVTPGATKLLGFCNEFLVMSALAAQPDGRLVLAGTRYYADGRSQAVVIRLFANGAIDTGFGVQGLATLARAPALLPNDVATMVAVLPGAPLRIVVGGTAVDRAASNDPDLMMFLLDGDGNVLPVGNFPDSGGLRYWRDAVQRPGWACRVARSYGGLLMVGALAHVTATVECARPGEFSETPFLFRIDTQTNLAPIRRAWWIDPAVPLEGDGFSPPNRRHVVAGIGRDARSGRLWVAGSRQAGDGGVASGVAAFRPDLQPDTSALGGAGRAVFTAAQGFTATSLHVQADGKLVLAGAVPAAPATMAALRASGDSGALDTAFGGAGTGVATLTFASRASIAFSVLKAAADGLVLAGNTVQSDYQPIDLVVVGLLNDVDAGFADGFE